MRLLSLVTAIFLAGTASAQSITQTPGSGNSAKSESASSSHLDLSTNECLNNLNDHDIVIASIAFNDGVAGHSQLKELVSRQPWGALTAGTVKEIRQQLDTLSPFLIITLTKKQVLTLDNHRDIIRWVLVQSTTKPCE